MSIKRSSCPALRDVTMHCSSRLYNVCYASNAKNNRFRTSRKRNVFAAALAEQEKGWTMLDVQNHQGMLHVDSPGTHSEGCARVSNQSEFLSTSVQSILRFTQSPAKGTLEKC